MVTELTPEEMELMSVFSSEGWAAVTRLLVS